MAAEVPPSVTRIVSQVKEHDLLNLVRQISGEDPMIVGANPFLLTNRYTPFMVGVTKATQFAHDDLQALGLSVFYQSWNGGFPPANGRNVIAVQPGGVLSNEIVYVTAHIDDMDDYGRAPGADDNASGTAAVLTAARLFSQQRFDRTIRYAIFTGEEQGLVGSAEAAKQANRSGERIVAVVNIDMIGWASVARPRAAVCIRPVTDPAGYSNDLALASVFTNVAAATGLTNTIEPTILANGETADQASFWQYGYPGFLAIEDTERDFNPYYHSSNDTLSHLNPAYYTALARAAIGTAAQLAQPAGDAPFESIAVASSDWRVGSAMGVGAFYARHDFGAAESGPDLHDLAWSNAIPPTNRLWFKAASQPDATELQTDSRPWTSETVFSGNLSFVNQTGMPASSSNAVRFRFVSPPLSNRVYSVRVRVDSQYAHSGVAFEVITNLHQLVAVGNGFLNLPSLTNLTDRAAYGTFDIAARLLDSASPFSLHVDSLPGQPLVVWAPAQVGAIITDVFEVSTNLGPDAIWLPCHAQTHYVGASNSAEFESGWSRITTRLDTSACTGSGTYFLRLKRIWEH